MITYSRQEMERQLVADQALWRRVPVALAALLWPLEILLLGWATGWWLGAATTLLLGVASVAVPPRLRINLYLLDLLERALRLPTSLGWLLLLWHLSLREPLFLLAGQPLLGAVAATLGLWVVARLLAPLSRFVAGQALVRPHP